jgi:2-polyprenyl-6-methoxyphenol hydroxylase-like FAD-dependent oxidoreductase
MEVVIAGGGVGGLALAGLLGRTGAHQVTVLERAPAYGAAGYGIGLYPLGGAVFNALGAAGELRSRSRELRTYRVHGPDGRVLQEVDLASLLHDYGPMLGVSRADLIDVLAAHVPEGAIRFGTQVTDARRHGERVEVATAGGDTFEGDVVVAADGMHSALRTALFGPVDLVDMGYVAWMWWAPPGTGPADAASEHWGRAAFVGLYPMPQGVNVAVAIPEADSPPADAEPADVLAALRATIEDRNPGAAALAGLWELGEARPFLWPMQDLRAPDIVALDHRAALLGDAGIGFLPTAGVGASNALRSAAALAYELSLADATTAPAALARWRQRVREVVEGNQQASRQMGKLMKVMMAEHRSTSALAGAIMEHLPITAVTKSIVKSMQAPF